MKTTKKTLLILQLLLVMSCYITAIGQSFSKSNYAPVLKGSEQVEETLVYFQKPSDWNSPVNIYIYDGAVNNNWPGEAMTLVEGSTYSFLIPESYQNPLIIFNAGSAQAPASGLEGFAAVNNGLYYKSGLSGLYDYGDNEVIKTFYFTKPAEWETTINAYVFDLSGTGGTNAAWPGEEMESQGDDVYKYTIDCTGYSKAMVIFNDGGTNQTADLVAVNNAWYNANGLEKIVLPLAVSSFTTDLESPQLLGTSITLTASAKNGNAPYEFKFSATINEVETDLTTYQSTNSTTWTPSINGEYTIKVYVKDADDAVVESELTYSIDVTIGMNMKKENSSLVYINNRTLFVQGEAGSQVAIVNLTGAVIEKFTLLDDNGSSTVLSPGIYIVSVENKATKIVVK